MCPFREHFVPRLFLLRFSFFETKSSARIRVTLKAPHSPVSVKVTSLKLSTPDNMRVENRAITVPVLKKYRITY